MTHPTVPLDTVTEKVVVGHVGPTSAHYRDDGVPFLRTQSVGSGEIRLEGMRYITQEFHDRLKKSQLKKGDVILSRVISDKVTCAIVPAELDGANCANIIVVRPSKELASGYLKHFLMTPLAQRALMKRKVGSAQSVVNTKVLKSWPIPLPPLEEQRRIAAILDKADAIRRKREETIRLTEEFLRSAFLDMFGDPVTNPKGWRVQPLNELAEIQGGLQVTRKRASLPVVVPYLRVANVYRDRLELTEMKTIRVTQQELSRVRLKTGDILMVEGHGNRNEIGRSAVWNGAISECLHQNHLIRVRVDQRQILPLFASAYLNSPGGRRQLFRFGKTTSGLNTISTSNVKQTKVFVPPIELQRRYLHLAECVSKTVDSINEAEKTACFLFESLAANAFSGELV